MSALGNITKNKKAIAGIVIVVILVAVYFIIKPSNEPAAPAQEVISKRVKLEVKETPETTVAVEGAATDASSATTAAQAPATQTPVKEDKPAETATKVETKPQAVKEEPKAVKKAEAPIEKKETLKKEDKATPAVKTALKEEKKEEKKAGPKEVKSEKADKPVKTEKAMAEKTEPKKKTAKKSEKAKTEKVSAKELASKPWAVNVASFPNLSEAQNFASSLKSLKYNSYITTFSKDETKWYRVRVGFYATEKEALKAGKKISDKFKVNTPWVVKPTKNEAAAHFD